MTFLDRAIWSTGSKHNNIMKWYQLVALSSRLLCVSLVSLLNYIFVSKLHEIRLNFHQWQRNEEWGPSLISLIVSFSSSSFFFKFKVTYINLEASQTNRATHRISITDDHSDFHSLTLTFQSDEDFLNAFLLMPPSSCSLKMLQTVMILNTDCDECFYQLL